MSSSIAIGSPSLYHFDPLDLEDGCSSTPNDTQDDGQTPFHNNASPTTTHNNNSGRRNTPSPVMVSAAAVVNNNNDASHVIIMHRIASYLSLNDTESLSAGGSSYYPTSRGGQSIQNNQHQPPLSHHSTDYTYRSRSNSTPRNNININRSYERKNSEDEEDWFVGGQHSINSSLAGLNESGTNSTSLSVTTMGGVTPHPGFVTLNTLEEEPILSPLNVVQNTINNDQGGDNNSNNQSKPATAALEQQQQQAAGEGDELDESELSPWTPAGQGTCESEDGSSSSLRDMHNMNVVHQGAGTVVSSVHSEITNYHEDDSPPPPAPISTSSSSSDHNHNHNSIPKNKVSDFFQQRKRHRLQKQALQNKLAAAVFSHPHPLRQYCLDAYSTALNLSIERQKQRSNNAVTCITPSDVLFQKSSSSHYQQNNMIIEVHGNIHLNKQDIIPFILSNLLSNIPLSVLLDFIEATCDISLETLYASGKIGSITFNKVYDILSHVTHIILDILSHIPNPLQLFEFVVGVQRSAMGKTGDVLVSGIQSVATGVGSVSNAALNRLSRSGLALAGGVVGGSRSGLSRTTVGEHSNVNHENILESKLFHRLQKMESVSKLVAYSERRGEEAFSRHAKKRAQRMMHYNVSFRPFTATIQSKDIATGSPSRQRKHMRHNVSFESENGERMMKGGEAGEAGEYYDEHDDNDSMSSESINSSTFMRTPTSFPPTPRSRLYYFERGSQFTENVVFLARDQLRIERGVVNHNEQTRAMSRALIDGSRLAVFDAANIGNGIALTCGQHIATKVGNSLYCSCRSMIPVMRNSYVYFEISVSPSAATTGSSRSGSGVPQVDATTLLVGLSTLEMPLDTLVGTIPASVGLCSTGQILQSGQWYSPSNPEDSAYGSNSTVGCLVYLDDNSAYENGNGSEGPHVSMDVTFNINGKVVPSCSSASIFNGGSGGETTTTTSSEEDNPNSSSSAGQRPPSESEPTLSLIVPKSHEIFPTVTLHSSGTSVMCRFSAEDLLANTRSEIGVTSGVVVYAVDGSVILDVSEGEDENFMDTNGEMIMEQDGGGDFF